MRLIDYDTFAVLLLEYLARFAQMMLAQYMGQRAMHDVRRRAFAHLLSLRAAYFDRQQVGRLMSRVTSDVEAISEAFAAGIITIAGDVMMIIGIVAVMLTMNARLTAA